MDPRQRARSGGRIWRSVGQGAGDPGVDTVNPLYGTLCLVSVPEGGHCDEARSAAQAAMHVFAKVRMVEHALNRSRVEHL